MGGGDLNMKKSWHPVLLVNQERVWKAEKAANEDKKAIAQLKKEREEERQLAELQRLQEERTGKKRVDKLDWMYAAPSNEGNALGGARISETMMEDYLLGKRRVDDVLAQSDKNVGNTHKDFIAVQNANTARDTASKIREDPLLAIKKQEEAALRAMANRPDVRKALRAMKNGDSESKEERKARKRAEKDDRRRERHERREKRRDYSRSRSPKSEYSRDRDGRRGYSGRDRGDHGRDRDEFGREERRRYRSRSRSSSPKREREESRRTDDSPRRYRDDRSESRRDYYDDRRRSDRREDDRYRDERRPERERGDRVPSPRHNPSQNGHTNGKQNGHDSRDVKPHHSRPGAMDMADRPTSARPSAPAAPPPSSGGGSSLDDMRAARLAAMASSARDMDEQRAQSLKVRAERERLEEERDMAMRARMGKEAVNAGFFNSQKNLTLGEAMSRRGGQGLQRAI